MQQTKLTEKQTASALVIPGLLVAAPAAIFYLLLSRLQLNLPVVDDYWTVLDFASRMKLTHGAAPRLEFLLSNQHNEYKLFFVSAIVWLQSTLLGHVSFVQLCVLGNGAVVLLAVLIWSIHMPRERDLGRRLAFFVPVSWLLFQLQYFETLNWAMASLQNLWVIVFSLGTICCLARGTRQMYGVALILYGLAVAASGNGFLLLPVGLLMLIIERRVLRAAGLLATSALLMAAYAYHYNIGYWPHHQSGFAHLLRIRPDFVLAFIGNAGAIAGTALLSECLSLTVGAALLLLFGWLLRRGYFKRRRLVGYCVLFLLLTAVGVGGLRSDFGLMQSLAPRYIIYGLLLVIFAWIAVVEEFLWRRSGPLLTNDVYLAATLGAVLLGLSMDAAGYMDLVRRNHETIEGMALYEHPESSKSMDGPVLEFSRGDPAQRRNEPIVRGILDQSIALGIYEPPKY